MVAAKPVRSVLTIVAWIIIGISSIDATTWCIITNTASPARLQPHLDYACSHGADCGPLQPGGECHIPYNIYSHTAYAYNSYYIHWGKIPTACYFNGTAQITFTDPSPTRQCRFPSSL
ncbi:hypothetical protein Lal_00050054 [Lupinus albus]|nr:hypothetical protein Lal_00050006 [Lupinus albus]KAF1867623.1 hypothetical protein Lal_00050054 [Lupinus albus]